MLLQTGGMKDKIGTIAVWMDSLLLGMDILAVWMGSLLLGMDSLAVWMSSLLLRMDILAVWVDSLLDWMAINAYALLSRKDIDALYPPAASISSKCLTTTSSSSMLLASLARFASPQFATTSHAFINSVPCNLY